MTAASEQEMVEVELVGLSVREYQAAQQHDDELVRELSLLALDAEAESTPKRLMVLMDELREGLSTLTAPARQQIQEALERGDDTADVVVRVPSDAAETSRRLLRLLDEADELSRQGDLLTLAAPPEVVSFRRWYLGQIAGNAP